MEFWYPRVRRFPFDEIIEQAVRRLSERGWRAPEVQVTFNEGSQANQRIRSVRTLQTPDCRLVFRPVQETELPGWQDDDVGVEIINIRGKELRVASDESGPNLWTYAGTHWLRDAGTFMNVEKVGARSRGEPRMYCVYRGSLDERRVITRLGCRLPYLVCDGDDGREYLPANGQPRVLLTDVILQEFTQYLARTLLPRIRGESFVSSL